MALMAVAHIPLVGQVTQKDVSVALANALTASDQLFSNAHFTSYKNEQNGSNAVYVSPSEGFTASTAPGAGTNNGTAIKVWTGNSNKIVTAFGATNSTIYLDSTSLGAITGLAGYISETTISGTPYVFITSESNHGYYYDTGGASLTEITDVDFPSKQTPARTITGNFVQFSGFTGIMCTDGTFWHSDINAGATAWTSTSNLLANDQPDAGIGAIKYGEHIVLFGKGSIEFWRNTGNQAGAVLSRVVGATSDVGCINQYAMVNFMDTIAFIGTQDGVGIYLLDGFKPRKISTHPVDLLARQNSNTARLNVISSWGQPKLMVTYTPATDAAGHIYDPATGIWTAYKSVTITQADTVQLLDGSVKGVFYVGANSNGKYYYNNNTAATLEIQTQPIDLGTSKFKTMTQLAILGDPHITGVNVSVRFNDRPYDNSSWGTARTLTLGQKASEIIPIFKKCGRFQKRSIYVTLDASAATYIPRLSELEIEYEVLAL